MTNGKTILENTIIFDKGLSLEAIGLYAIIKHYSTISNFQIKRDHIKSVSGYGETAFRRVWKELKDNNLLLEHKKRINGKFKYEFTLSTKKFSAEKEIKKIQHKKEYFKTLDEQVAIEESLQASEAKEATLLGSIIKATGCTIEVAKSSIDYAKQHGANNIKAYAIASINKGFTVACAPNQDNTYRSNYTSNNSKRFNNFETKYRSNRHFYGNMTYEEIESQLLGWYNDEPEEAKEIGESTEYNFLKEYGIDSSIAN